MAGSRSLACSQWPSFGLCLGGQALPRAKRQLLPEPVPVVFFLQAQLSMPPSRPTLQPRRRENRLPEPRYGRLNVMSHNAPPPFPYTRS